MFENRDKLAEKCEAIAMQLGVEDTFAFSHTPIAKHYTKYVYEQWPLLIGCAVRDLVEIKKGSIHIPYMITVDWDERTVFIYSADTPRLNVFKRGDWIKMVKQIQLPQSEAEREAETVLRMLR